jgi:hypothetical protein
MAVSVDGAESGGGGGLKTSGLRGTLTGCTSDSKTLGLYNGNPKAMPRCRGGVMQEHRQQRTSGGHLSASVHFEEFNFKEGVSHKSFEGIVIKEHL